MLNYVTDQKGMTQGLLNKIGIPDALRGRTIEDIKKNKGDWRLFIQSCLYKDLVDGCGAMYYTLFFIRSDKGYGDYWLIHFLRKAPCKRCNDAYTLGEEHQFHPLRWSGHGVRSLPLVISQYMTRHILDSRAFALMRTLKLKVF